MLSALPNGCSHSAALSRARVPLTSRHLRQDKAVSLLTPPRLSRSDIEMGEPLSIVGFTFGVVGLLSTVRNGITTLHHDSLVYREYRDRLFDVKSGLETWEQRMISWRDFWMDEQGESETLYEVYWGQSGLNSIRERLERIAQTGETIKHLFHIKDAPSSKKTGEKFKHLIHVKDAFSSKKEKIKFVLTGLAEINDQLATLKTHVEELWIYSMDVFREKHGAYRDPDRPMIEKAKYDEISSLMTTLVEDTSLSSAALYALCTETRNEEAIVIGLDLDLMDSNKAISSQFSVLEQFKKAKELNLKMVVILVKEEEFGPAWRVKVSRVDQNALAALNISTIDSLVFGLEQLVLKDRSGQFFVGTPDDIYFLLNGVREENDAQPVALLRDELWQLRQANLIRAKDPFSEATRLDLTQGLVRCGLLLSKTPWFSHLRSCGIQLVELSDKTRYVLRANPAGHLEPGPLSLPSKPCWCGSKSNGQGLVLLGIILIEIALGAPVCDFQKGIKRGRCEITVFLDKKAQEFNLQEIVELVEDATDAADYGKVVRYCLVTTREEIQIEDLEDYFWKVLLP